MDALRSRFKAFATFGAFLTRKGNGPNRPIQVQVLLQSVRLLTVEELAIYSGVLGLQVLRLFWATPGEVDPDHDQSANDEPCLYASLQLQTQAEQQQQQQQPPAKRQRRSSKQPAASLPESLLLLQVTALISAFDTKLDALLRDSDKGESILARLASEYLPRRKAPPISATDSQSSMDDVVADLQRQSFYHGQIVCASIDPAVDAQYASLSESSASVDSRAWTALRETRGIEQLYSHQALAIDWVMQGHDVVVSTATASGKSVIYQLPILDLLLRDPQARILIVYPTKALAQDQLSALKELLAHTPALSHVLVSTLDGDTPSAAVGENQRAVIRQSASVILTNPDTLHVAMLPGVAQWKPFWACLRMVVIDELHIYQSRLGQHVAHILSRLQRLVRGSSPVSSNRLQFVACSATTSNPQAHMQQLTHRSDIKVVDTDGSPHGARHLVLWDSLAKGLESAVTPFSDVAYIAGYLLRCGKRAIVFCKTRQACELTQREISDYLSASADLRPFRSQVMSYRGGYTPRERREIEAAMFSGRTRMVVATSALELGIDVGSLDAVLMVGVPYTTASLWQQAGRAGRRSQAALAMVVATAAPIDRHAVASSSELQTAAVFARCFAPAEITSDSAIAAAHLQCAAFEQPVDASGIDSAFAVEISSSGDLVSSALTWDEATLRWACPMSCKPWPAAKVSIRSSSEKDCWQVVLVAAAASAASTVARRVLEEMEANRALYALYGGGIFLHRGQSYAIELVDPETCTALVTRANVSWYTQKRDYTDVVPALALSSAQPKPHVQFIYGDVEVATTGIGYKRIDSRTRKVVETVDRLSPRLSRKSRGVWVDLPAAVSRSLVQHGYAVEASMHGAQHALLTALCSVIRCASTQLATQCIGHEMAHCRDKPLCLVVYEISANDSEGLLSRAVALSSEIVELACRRATTCLCEDGCVECVLLSAGCREQNRDIDCAGARLILRWLSSSFIE